jgi:hypothetical protein
LARSRLDPTLDFDVRWPALWGDLDVDRRRALQTPAAVRGGILDELGQLGSHGGEHVRLYGLASEGDPECVGSSGPARGLEEGEVGLPNQPASQLDGVDAPAEEPGRQAVDESFQTAFQAAGETHVRSVQVFGSRSPWLGAAGWQRLDG